MIVTTAISKKKILITADVWTNYLAASTFGLFIRLVQTWCTSLEEQTTQEFQSSVSGRGLEVFGSRRPSPYFDHVSLISLRHLESVVKAEEISIFFWKFCFFPFALYCIRKKCGQWRGKPENKDTCDVCLFFPDGLIDAVTTKISDHGGKYTLDGFDARTSSLCLKK